MRGTSMPNRSRLAVLNSGFVTFKALFKAISRDSAMLTFAIQKTGYDYHQTDPQGETDLVAFQSAIDAFPWAEQHQAWEEEQEGPLPALVLQNEADQRALWVTALGTDRAGSYQLQSVSMKLRKGFFGKGKLEQDATVVDARSRAEVDRLCELFCDVQYEALDREVARLAERNREDSDD